MLLNHVMVAVTDMDRSVAFYEGLGFELIVRGSHDGTDGYARFVLPGNVTLSLHIDATQDRRTTVIGLDCEGDLDGVIARWQAAGYSVVGPYEQPWLWREAYLRDPAGNRVCLFHAGVNRHNPPWRQTAEGSRGD